MVRCTPNQFKEFEESHIWLDMIDELNIWLERVRDELENQALSDAQHRVLQGNAETLHALKTLPEMIRKNLEADKEEPIKEGD